MRSSQIARQTAQVVEALSSPRRTLRSGRSSLGAPKPANQRIETGRIQSDTTPSPTKDSNILVSSVSTSTRKRKRGQAEPPSPFAPRVSSEIDFQASTTILPQKGQGSKPPKKARRQPAKKIKGEDGEIKIEPPPNWERVYELTKEMRSMWPAPVDTMGCESLAEDERSPKDQRFQTLVALMLSSQTKDTVTAVAMQNLREGTPGGFTLESVRKMEPSLLNSLIAKVGFHNNKTKFIKQVVEILQEQHSGDIPDTIDGLIALPGVGPKMAYLCMSAAWGRDEGIGVDVHVHRITNLWGWHKTANPEETRMMLESWLPKEKWHDINHLLVGFGQTWCPPVGRKCDECKLSSAGLCPSAVVAKDVQKRVKKETVRSNGGDGDEILDTKVGVNIVEGAVKAKDTVDPGPTVDSPLIADIEDSMQDSMPDRGRRSGRFVQALSC